jgi:hypothetical protein
MKIIADPTDNLARGLADAGLKIPSSIEPRLTAASDFDRIQAVIALMRSEDPQVRAAAIGTASYLLTEMQSALENIGKRLA